MGKNNKSGNAAVDLLTILNAVNSSDKNASDRHKEITGRLDKIEKQYDDLKVEVKKVKKENKEIRQELDYLQSAVNALQQDKLNANLIIRGIPEIERKPEDLSDMVLYLFSKVSTKCSKENVTLTIRLGNKNNEGKKRPILVKLTDEVLKTEIMSELKKQRFNCSNLCYYNEPWGSESDIIYVGDNLTQTSSTLFYEARKLKLQHLVKYVWTKNGKIFVKQSEGQVAYRIQNVQQLQIVKAKLGIGTLLSSTKDDDHSEESDDSQTDTEQEKDDSVVITSDGKRRLIKSPEEAARPTRQKPRTAK